MDLIETCIELNLEFIEEAGGVVSWLKRLYTATDDSVVHELEQDITIGIRSEEHRARLLREIDGFIREAREAEHGGALSDFMRGGVIALQKRGDARRTGTIRAYIQRLETVRAKVASFKIKG